MRGLGAGRHTGAALPRGEQGGELHPPQEPVIADQKRVPAEPASPPFKADTDLSSVSVDNFVILPETLKTLSGYVFKVFLFFPPWANAP